MKNYVINNLIRAILLKGFENYLKQTQAEGLTKWNNHNIYIFVLKSRALLSLKLLFIYKIKV